MQAVNRPRLHPLRGPRQQRGVTAIFAAVSLVTLLSAVGLAIDVGRLYYSNRELQRLSDLAAIDGARVQSQCLGSAGIAEVTAEVDASLKRNRLPEGVTVVTRLGNQKSGSDGLQFFQPVIAGEAADSVQVTLSRTSPARILPLFAGDQSRKLTTRAAAYSEWLASASVGPPIDDSSSGNFKPVFFGGPLGTSVAFGGGSGAAGASATLTVSDLVNQNRDVSVPLPDMDVPTPVQGLLSNIEALLNQAGDSAAASAVSAYADALAAAKPGAEVIPAEVLGLPARGSYDGATATVGDVLNAIAGAVSQGDAIQLPNLCALLPVGSVDELKVLPALCDSTITARVPQGSRPGTFNSSTQILDVSNSNDDVASSAAGLLEVRVRLVNPITGEKITVPLKATAEKAEAKVTALSCVRLGQSQNIASVRANGPVVRFAIGDSNSFTTSFTSSDVDLGNVLNDVQPTRVLTASVKEILNNAGLGSPVINNPLFAGFLGQPVTISVRVPPMEIGDGRREEFCMQGPPYHVAEQCNGAPARIGGVSSQEAVERLANALGNVELSVQLPQGLPAPLDALLQTATTTLTDTLNAQLKQAFTVLAPQLVPVLQSVNLAIGESSVYLLTAEPKTPKVYAQ